MEVASNKKNHLLYKYLLLIIMILLIIVSAGWMATDYLGNIAKKEIIRENENAVSILSIYFADAIKEIEGVVEAVSGSPWIAPALVSRRDQDIAKANAVLDRYNSSFGVSVCYLIDGSGVTIASSNRKAPDSFVGNSYKFRPYFTQAMKGSRGHYFALGVTSGKRGAYVSQPVRDTRGKIIGVAVIKKELDEIETYLSYYPFGFIVDRHGIIFLSSRKEMLLKSLWPINREIEAALVASRQFGDKTFQVIMPREVSDGMDVRFNGKNYYVSRKVLNPEGWSLVLMAPRDKVFLYRSIGLIVTILVCLLAIVLAIIIYMTLRSIDRKQAEKALRESEARYYDLYNNAPNMYYSLDLKTRTIRECNETFLRVTGYSKQEIVGRPIIELYHADCMENVKEYLQQLELTGEFHNAECQVRCKDGRIIDVALDESTVRDKDGNTLSSRSIWHDITDRRRAEAAFRESEEKHRIVVENAIEAIFVLQEGLVKFINPASLELLGYSKEELTSMPFTDFIHTDDREFVLKNNIRRLKGEDLPSVYPFRIIAKEGIVKWVEVHDVNISWEGKPATLNFLGDITERKSIEKERRGSIERLRKALGATVQTISAIVEYRDPYTAGHQRNVADLARAIAAEIGLANDQIDGIRISGIIHDLGKISIPAEILCKPTKLTDLEFSLIKGHPQAGYDILKGVDFVWPIARIVLEHHERIDGSGYPNGLRGNDILMESRILSVADVVESMSSHRPYRPALGIDAALNEIEKNKGTLYDAEAVDACLRLFREKGFNLQEFAYKW